MKKYDFAVNRDGDEWNTIFCGNELSKQNAQGICGGSNGFQTHFATLSNSDISLDPYGRVLIKHKGLLQAINEVSTKGVSNIDDIAFMAPCAPCKPCAPILPDGL